MNIPVPEGNQPPRPLRMVVLVVIVIGVLVALSLWKKPESTNQVVTSKPGQPDAITVPDEFKRGEQLSKQVCSSCHVYAPPDLLDKVTWGLQILPAMADKVGFHEVPYNQLGLEPRVIAAKLIPEEPMMSIEDWRAICTYYLASAPIATAEPHEKPKIEIGLKQFDVVQPEFRSIGHTTMIKIDPLRHQIYLGESVTNRLVMLDSRGRQLNAMQVPSPPVSMDMRDDGMYLTLIGSYAPSDELEGKLVWLPGPRSPGGQPREVLSNLPRPVRTLFADLNQDGREDLLVCGFGNLLGQFSWFENKGTGYVEHVLMDRPGAIAAEIYDFNHDGKPDIMVMMAQAREGIYILYNEGNGEFSTPVPVVEHVPSWGSSNFQLVDFNGDGFMDVLETNGDEGDHPGYLPPYKQYHGIHLYLNDGKNNFKEVWSYQMCGAYKAIARDFRGNGKLDIAAISFYPHYKTNPYESFVYLENQGDMKFKAYSFKEALSGRWIVMDVGDVDGDGWPDIVIGSMQDGPSPVPSALHSRWREQGPTFLILKNRGPQAAAAFGR